MANLIGKGVIVGLAGGALAGKDLTGTALTGYISPRLDSIGATHEGEAVPIKDQDGKISGWIFNGDDGLSMDVDFQPQGSSIANAKLSSSLPPVLGRVEVSGLPVILVGSFADALNATTTNPWLYMGGGKITLPSDANTPATISMRLQRRSGVAASTAIV